MDMMDEAIKLMVKKYSAYDVSDEEFDLLNEKVGFFTCGCCGMKYPNGRESKEDVSVCDSCE